MLLLHDLPVEILAQILLALPLPSLLSFARTSRRNNTLASSTLSKLNIAAFPKRIHGLLAFVAANDSYSEDDDGRVKHYILTTKRSRIDPDEQQRSENHRLRYPELRTPPEVQRRESIEAQNQSLARVFVSPVLGNLSSLTLHTYALLSSSLSTTLAKSLPNLRHLNLNFSHPYIHDTTLPAGYWTSCPEIAKEGSPAWNPLCGLGRQHEEKLQMRNLRSLSIRRAAITSAQLLKWVSLNSKLEDLRFDMVTGTNASFVEGLVRMRADRRKRASLKRLAIERCPNLRLEEMADFEWVQALMAMGLQDLSLEGCANVRSDVLRWCSERRGWAQQGLQIIHPDEHRVRERISDDDDVPVEVHHKIKWQTDAKQRLPLQSCIEVDPEYMAL